jgi:hypothetical protein
MLNHRTAAAGDAPHARQPVVASFLTYDASASRIRLTLVGWQARVTLRKRPDCACGCCGAWSAHLVYVELLRLRVQRSQPRKGVV